MSAPTNGIRFYSPLVLNIAAQEGIGMAELEKIPGTGNDSRVTMKDILHYVSTRKGGGTSYTPKTAPKEDVLVVPMNRVEQPAQQPAPNSL